MYSDYKEEYIANTNNLPSIIRKNPHNSCFYSPFNHPQRPQFQHNILQIEYNRYYDPDSGFSAAAYFKDVIGVTVNPKQRPVNVHLFVDRRNAPYVLTKPLHQSQEIIKKSEEGIKISIHVIPNFELEREILGYGDSICVLYSLSLRNRIERILYNAKKLYSDGG